MVHTGGCSALRIGFDAEQEIGAYEDALERSANAIVETAGGVAPLVKGKKRFDVIVGRRSAISAARQSG